MIEVEALRSINAGGRQRMTHERFELDDEVAAYLHRAGQVRIVEELAGQVVETASTGPTATRARKPAVRKPRKKG